MLSQRVEALGVSPNRKYNALAAAAEKRGTEVLRLNIGQPDIEAPQLYFDALASYPQRQLAYAPSQGIAELREAESLYYKRNGLSVHPDQIYITSGATEAISLALTALCDPGDGVMLLEPYYTNYGLITHILGLETQPIHCRAEENYRVPEDEQLDRLVQPNSRVLLLSNPGNPTGRVYDEKEMDRIHRFVKRHQLVLLADEVYREFNFSGRPFHSFGEYDDLEEQLVLLDSASKKYAVCGARIGSLAVKNEEVGQAIMKLCQMRLAVPSVEQYAVAQLVQLPPSYFEGVADLYRKRRDVLQEALEAMGEVTYSSPEGAFYTLARLPVDDAERLVVWMLNEFSCQGATVLPSPAAGFYATPGLGRDEIRISYCLDEKVLRRAMLVLDKALDLYPGSRRGKKQEAGRIPAGEMETC